MGDVPKPRALVPVENPLRRRERAAPPTPRSEDEILDALTALAGGALTMAGVRPALGGAGLIVFCFFASAALRLSR